MSSSAFFNDAAAKTVRLFSWAAAAPANASAEQTTMPRAVRNSESTCHGNTPRKIASANQQRTHLGIWGNHPAMRERRPGNSRWLTGEREDHEAVILNSQRVFLAQGPDLGFASGGASSTCLQAAGRCAIVIGGFGFGGTFGGFGWITESENQKSKSPCRSRRSAGGGLGLAIVAARRAGKAHMEMIVMPVIGPDLVSQPRSSPAARRASS